MLIISDIHIRFSFPIFKKNKFVDEVTFMGVLVTANNFFFKFFHFTSDGGYLIACFSTSNSNKQNQNWNQHLHYLRKSYPTILIQGSSEDLPIPKTDLGCYGV